jgi:hypothetical protein
MVRPEVETWVGKLAMPKWLNFTSTSSVSMTLIHAPRLPSIACPSSLTWKKASHESAALARMTPQEMKLTIGLGRFRVPMKTWKRNPIAGRMGINQSHLMFSAEAAWDSICPCTSDASWTMDAWII